MNFGTATKAELIAAGFTMKTIRPRRPRKGELICQRVGFKTKRGSQQWAQREHIASPSAYAVVMGNGWQHSTGAGGQLMPPCRPPPDAPSDAQKSTFFITYKRFQTLDKY